LLFARSAGWGSLLLVPAFIVLASMSAEAHGAVHEQIAEVTEQLKANPTNAGLYVKRGELHSDHGDWDAALSDYDHAGQLNPSLSIVELARGRTLFQAARFDSAKEALDRYLGRQPNHTDALVLRARVLAQLGHLSASAIDYTRAIDYLAEIRRPNPDYYFERARVVAAQGRAQVREALRGLDDGMVTLGPLPTLQLYAIELELTIGRTDAALTRLDAVARQQPNRPEAWLVRRGEILEHAGRIVEARKAYEEAAAAIDLLSQHRRGTRATLELETRIKEAISRLQR
jgi:tetratricopeptide (TPR) repeat protein